jgi:hypothetical protein
MLMRYHWGLAIGHVYAQTTPTADSDKKQASTVTNMQSLTDVQASTVTDAPPNLGVEFSGQEQEDLTHVDIEVCTGLPVLSSISNDGLSRKSLKFSTRNVKTAMMGATT